MIDQLILGLLVAMFASFGGVAWKFRGRIEKLPKEATEEMKADLLKAIKKNGEAIAENRDRIDEVHKDLSARIDLNRDRIDLNRDRIDGNRDRIDEVHRDLSARIDGNRDRIDELRKDLGARIDLNGDRIDGNRDRIDEVRKELSGELGGQIGYTNRRIDDIYRHLTGGSSDSTGGESGAEASPA